jgi:betaine-aldehyde dehydrogenase
MYKGQMLINGQRVDASGGKWIERRSPGNDEIVSRVPEGTAEDVNVAVAAARATFDEGGWAYLPGSEKAEIFLAVAGKITERTDELARLESLESGKVISQARDEMGWTAGLWKYAAALSQHLYGDSCNTLGASKLAMTLRDPIGVVGIITPWNFPLLVMSQKLPFALAAGCTCVLKPSELTSSTTLLLGDILNEAGLPDGVVNIVTGYGAPVGKTLCEHDDVDMISFTGSTQVGKAIVAASAGNLKKVSLELGGKNPILIFDDADLDVAVDASKLGAYFNQGECCNASSRLLVQEGIADAFVEKLKTVAADLIVGDPLDEKSKLGAIINEQQQDKITDAIQEGIDAGAKVALGGKAMCNLAGRYVETTILDHVTPDMSVASSEIFGPVVCIIRFKDAEEALQIANGTPYGLSAGVFTSNYETAINVSRRLQAGTVWVNTWLEGHNELSFGGFKQSGLGRELGQHAVEEFTEAKTIQFHTGNRQPWW